MAENGELVAKILALQGKVDATLIPKYEQAEKAVADLTKQMDDLINLGKLTKAQAKQFSAASQQLPIEQANMKAYAGPAKQQQTIQAQFGSLLSALEQQTKNMSSGTQGTFDSLKTQAFASPADPAAQEAFKKYASNLQKIPTENITKSLRQWVQGQIKQGLSVSIDEFARQQQRFEEGSTGTPDENPQLKKQFDAARATGFRRLGNNFRTSWNSGEAITVGYAGLDFLQGVGRYAAEPMSGDRFTAEARYRSGLGLLPGGLGLLGAGLGALTGPGGAYAGGLIGAGIGSAIEAPLSAASEKHEDLRLTSEYFSQVMGKGTAAADKFVSAINSTADKMGTPAAELAQSLRSLSGSVVGFNPARAAALQGTLQRGAGDLYPELVSAQARAAMQIPLSNNYQDMIAGNRAPSSGLYQDAANYYALHGDLDASNKQLIAAGQFAYTPAEQRAQAARGRMQNALDAEDPFSGFLDKTIAQHIPFSVLGRRKAAIDATDARLRASGQDAPAASGPMKVQRDALYTANRTAQEMSEALGYDVARAGVGVGMAQMTGLGAAGMRPYTAQEVAALTQQQAQLRIQEQQVQIAIRTAKPEDRGEFKADLGRVQLALAQANAQIKQAQVGLFQETVAEQQARFEGGYGRLGIGSDALTLGGASSFDPRVSRNLAQRRSFLSGQSAYDLGLASDMTNFLSPMEREARRTSAAQEDLQSRFVLPNQYALQRIGDTQAASGLRQADIRTQVARGQATGDISTTLTAQNTLIAEQVRLQGELQQRLSEGNLTYSQRTQLQSQIKDLTVQTISAQRQAADTAMQGFQGRAEAQSTTSYLQGERGVRLRGTSAETLAQAAAGYDASLSGVAVARLRILDPTLSPDRRVQLQSEYQGKVNSAEQQGIDAFSTVQMGPVFERRRIEAEAGLSRQMRSAFEPGSVLQSQAGLAKMDQQQIDRIDASYKFMVGRQDLTREQKEVIARNLTSQREDTRNDMFDRQQSVDVGWVDRLVSMSVNSPSFAARLMPGSDRVASFAERRGLGRMSARVFGYNDQNSYRGAEGMGVLPSEMSRFAFGMRPGDYPGGMGPDAPIIGGTGRTLDSIDGGGSGSGLPPQMVGELSQTLGLLASLLKGGININITQIDKSTGQQAAHTQNSGTVYNAREIMAGGKAPGRY